MSVHGNTIHNSHNMEATPISRDGRMGKQNLVQKFDGRLFTVKKESNSDTYYNIHQPCHSQKDKYSIIPLTGNTQIPRDRQLIVDYQ